MISTRFLKDINLKKLKVIIVHQPLNLSTTQGSNKLSGYDTIKIPWTHTRCMFTNILILNLDKMVKILTNINNILILTKITKIRKKVRYVASFWLKQLSNLMLKHHFRIIRVSRWWTIHDHWVINIKWTQ
jgi:hypothetical protein